MTALTLAMMAGDTKILANRVFTWREAPTEVHPAGGNSLAVTQRKPSVKQSLSMVNRRLSNLFFKLTPGIEIIRIQSGNNTIIEQAFTTTAEMGDSVLGESSINTSTPTKSGSTTINGEGTYNWTILTRLGCALVGTGSMNDRRFRFVIEVPNGIGDLNLRMTSDLDQHVNDESWGIDNFVVTPAILAMAPQATALLTIAIANYSRNTSQGEWQWSSDGSNWNNIDEVANAGQSVVINADDEIRFQPALNFNGTPPTLSVSLVDSSADIVYSSGALLNVSNRGGSTPGAAIWWCSAMRWIPSMMFRP